MGFNYYEKYHIHGHVFSKGAIESKINVINNDFIHCLYHKEIQHQKILFYGSMSELLIPYDLVIKEMTVYIQETDNNTQIEAYLIIFNNTVVHSQAASLIQ